MAMTRIENLAAATARAKIEADQAKAVYDQARKALTKAMDDNEIAKVDVDVPAKSGAPAIEVHATMVRSSTERLNPDIIDHLDETQRKAVTTMVIDPEKLAAAVVLGVVSDELVAEFTEKVDRKPYVKVVAKPLTT